MYRSTVRFVLDMLLLVSVVAVVVTGVIIERLDLHQFRLHTLTGYAMTVLVVVHVALNWRRLVRFWTPGRRRDQAPTAAIVATDAGIDGGSGAANDGHGSDEGSTPPIAARTGRSRRAVLASLFSGAAGVAAGWITRSAASPTPYDGGDVGLFYHRESSLGVRGLLSNVLNWGRQPPRYKDFVERGAIALPSVAVPPGMSVAQAMGQRRSLREYADRAMTAEELAWVVHAATGITDGAGLRTAPSAGALYPIETYVAVNRVDGIDAGLYHVDVRAQALQPVRVGSVGGDLLIAGLGQDFLRTAPVVLVLTGYFQRTRWKYRERHYRYVCWEAGHIAQNVYLAGEAAGLGACVVAAFFDDTLNDLLRVDGRAEAALGFVAVGPR